MPVSGIVITCAAEEPGIADRIAGCPGVEVHASHEGRIAAVIESDSVEGEIATMTALLALEGVLDVRLAYHNFEDVAASST